YAIAGRPRF
uniref:Peptide tyrosine phenylalanine 3 n=1 Tax=Penaeus monodon TaxID=6687 RepID=PYF3_PENMO|nr:RecName: Full=Peptide tyrosine phenylalanine 3; AltName: Full=Pem-PYF3 [Penaeus monodon]